MGTQILIDNKPLLTEDGPFITDLHVDLTSDSGLVSAVLTFVDMDLDIELNNSNSIELIRKSVQNVYDEIEE